MFRHVGGCTCVRVYVCDEFEYLDRCDSRNPRQALLRSFSDTIWEKSDTCSGHTRLVGECIISSEGVCVYVCMYVWMYVYISTHLDRRLCLLAHLSPLYLHGDRVVDVHRCAWSWFVLVVPVRVYLDAVRNSLHMLHLRGRRIHQTQQPVWLGWCIYLVGWLIGWLIDWLIDWLVGWLIGW
jgi:hypothetical protein